MAISIKSYNSLQLGVLWAVLLRIISTTHFFHPTNMRSENKETNKEINLSQSCKTALVYLRDLCDRNAFTDRNSSVNIRREWDRCYFSRECYSFAFILNSGYMSTSKLKYASNTISGWELSQLATEWDWENFHARSPSKLTRSNSKFKFP